MTTISVGSPVRVTVGCGRGMLLVGLTAARKMIGSGLYSFIVLDSVGGMSSKAELDKNADPASRPSGEYRDEDFR